MLVLRKCWQLELWRTLRDVNGNDRKNQMQTLAPDWVEILQDETGTEIAIAIGPIVVYTMWIPQNELRIWKRP
jgi:hypothetical protein